MNDLPAWGDVVATALVGTDRRSLRVPASDATDPAVALLEAAGALTLHRRAGVAAVVGITPPQPSPVDTAPLVSGKAVARLADLVTERHDRSAWQHAPIRDAEARTEVLGEWLAAVAARGLRVPGDTLPVLLDVGRRHRALRPLVAAAGGARAGWLAAQRADWGYLSVEPSGGSPADGALIDGEAWEFGATGRRVNALAAARRRDPAAARALLEAAWESETPDDRAALLAVLSVGLSTGDEPLLERALDDRRKEVRVGAVELLARLPDSGYGRRMAERVTAHVDVEGDAIRITPPSSCDRSMRRDGISPKPPAGMGERAWWLEELITRAPLATWGDPHEFLAKRVPEGWAPVLRRGLARAAAAQGEPAWATALTAALTDEVAAGGRPDDRLLLEALYDALPAEALVDIAVPALRRGLAGAAAVGVEHVLELCPRPWPDALAGAVFAALEEYTDRRAAGGWRLAGLCELAALRLPADTVTRAETLTVAMRAGRPDDPTVQIAQRLTDTLRFRHDMLQELQ